MANAVIDINKGQGQERRVTTPFDLVNALNPQDKATIMSLCMPKGANDSELALYLYRCQQQGFDPLSGELVLQKRHNKDGSVALNFITTRDALLKKAEQNPNYNGINSGVVKEGDLFEVDTEKSIVKHKFGTNRKKIIAAWAIVYHKTRLPVIAVVDFEEYFYGLSNSPVWQKMPSAMIQKVAEAAALRRQFPILGQGVYTAEEMQMEQSEAPQDNPKQQTEGAKVDPKRRENNIISVVEGEVIEEATHEKEAPIAEEQPAPENNVEEVQAVQENPAQEQNSESEKGVFQLLELHVGKSGIGTPFARIVCQEPGIKTEKPIILLAKGEEGIVEAAQLKEGCRFKADITEEMGFLMVQKITVL
ncbi:phage recombination protein Bet [Desulfitobacterium hafniense]|uniref:phage recombination protein Bet n=1 Tax=Desulfitobacterium hafniense TaxID=49338 RepID=UPI00036DB558|nr:phage recombination protein Bet [Desulfitobacterium hafniense]